MIAEIMEQNRYKPANTTLPQYKITIPIIQKNQKNQQNNEYEKYQSIYNTVFPFSKHNSSDCVDDCIMKSSHNNDNCNNVTIDNNNNIVLHFNYHIQRDATSRKLYNYSTVKESTSQMIIHIIHEMNAHPYPVLIFLPIYWDLYSFFENLEQELSLYCTSDDSDDSDSNSKSIYSRVQIGRAHV